MTPETVLTIGRQALETLMTTASPVLLVILVAGLLISVLQALTQINEATLSFVPKLLLSADVEPDGFHLADDSVDSGGDQRAAGILITA